jgi:hypothetical protein
MKDRQLKDQHRREFLKKLAKGAVYAAPVIRTMTAPLEVVGQGKSTSHKNDHGNEGHGGGAGGSSPALGGAAPGTQPPPGSIPPP